MISRISRNAVKEGFDTLPAAICYFDRNGLLRLINHRMQEIAAVLCGRDLQTLTDLEQAMRSPGGGVRLRDEAARIYEFPDGTVYHFAVRPIQDKYGIPYTEVMATDVSRLAALHAALQQENERLADANRRAKRLYDNMPDIVREEEILKMKMQVHDDIGHTLLAARRALRHEHDLAPDQERGRGVGKLHLPAVPRPAGGCCRGPADLYAKAGGCSGRSRTAARCVPCGTRRPRALRTDPAGMYLQRCAACGRHGIVRRFRASATGMASLHHEQRRTAQGGDKGRRRAFLAPPPY